MGRPQDVGFACHGRGMDVDEGGRLQTCRLAPAQGSQRICGFTRLRHGHGQGTWRHGRAAVAEFRSDFDVDGQAGDLFKGVAGDRAGIVGGAASNNLQTRDL